MKRRLKKLVPKEEDNQVQSVIKNLKLRNNWWLNDIAMNGFIKDRCSCLPSEILICSTFILNYFAENASKGTQILKKLYSKQSFILLPVYCSSRSHWSLLLYKVSENTMYYMDSFLSLCQFLKLQHNSEIMLSNFCKFFGHKEFNSIIEVKVPQQRDSFSCGDHVLCLIQQFVNKPELLSQLNRKNCKELIKSVFTQKDVNSIRSILIQLLS